MDMIVIICISSGLGMIMAEPTSSIRVVKPLADAVWWAVFLGRESAAHFDFIVDMTAWLTIFVLLESVRALV